MHSTNYRSIRNRSISSHITIILACSLNKNPTTMPTVSKSSMLTEPMFSERPTNHD
uniref:Uncharacterized protein n=1 Tax=Arundo donax TaxID=35708 RepID=A0A0A9E2G1_ARUDO